VIPIYIASEQLHNGVFWVNEFSEPRVAEDAFIDVDGGEVVQRTTLSGGRKIVLEAKGSDSGGRAYFTRRQIELFEQYEISGAVVALVYNGISRQIRFPANCLSVTPLRDYVGHSSEDIYYGTLTVTEVNV